MLLLRQTSALQSIIPCCRNRSATSTAASSWRRGEEEEHYYYCGGGTILLRSKVQCCRGGVKDDGTVPLAGRCPSDSNTFSSPPLPPPPPPSPYQVLGVDPSCSFDQLKAAFRARVKEFHPDVRKSDDAQDSDDDRIRRVILAYELLSEHHKPEVVLDYRENRDPFDEPECEALDLFVNEVLCVGKACPYSCVKRAPHAFSFTSEDGGTARATSQGHGEDYQVHLAVGQCPRRCIYYVTPSQRAILEEHLSSILDSPNDPAETAFLDSLIARAAFVNNRYQKPKTEPRTSSTEFVDWY